MRTPPLNEMLSAKGAAFKEQYGVQIPSAFGDSKSEYLKIREGVGITDFSFMQKFRIPADSGLDFLDNIFPGNVAKIRFCRVLHTFLADEEGKLIADCYVANNDEDFIVLCESIIDDQTLKELLNKNGAKDAGLEDLTDTHVVISIDGYKAWAVAKDLFGADVLGLPYLSIETYPFQDTDISFFRSGKTSEFGYLIMAPKVIASGLMEKLVQTAKRYEGGLCGRKIHDDLRLEGRFFNIFAEGLRVKDPLPLGLQWMIDFDKEAFIGRAQILDRRNKGLAKKIIGIKAEESISDLAIGTKLFSEKKEAGVIEASSFSYMLNSWLGLALLPVDIAYAGLEFNLAAPGGAKAETISMPPIIARSLSVKLDEI